MMILLGEFNAKVRRENIFKQAIRNESLHQGSNDNGFRIVNFATSKNLVVKSTMFPHRNVPKYTWISPDGKTLNQIDYILIAMRWHSSILDVRGFKGTDCDSDDYLVVTKVRESLAVNKEVAKKSDGERFHLRMLRVMEAGKQYQIEITNRFTALENLNDEEDISRTWENIKGNIRKSTKKSLGLHELK